MQSDKTNKLCLCTGITKSESKKRTLLHVSLAAMPKEEEGKGAAARFQGGGGKSALNSIISFR